VTFSASNVLVGTDGSRTAARAVDRAAAIARACDGRLTVLMAGSERRSRPIVDAEVERLRGQGIDAHGLVAGTDPATALIEEAEAGGYDLVVVGNKGMTGPRRFFTLGAVPNKVSHHLARNLLIVRTT
jgi:nucleotide-binding universal stress UspA family protein